MTDLYQAHIAAEAAMIASDYDLDACQVADKAYAAYRAAVAAKRDEWAACPEGEAKFSAETNAHDTEGCAEDELRWLEIAVGTYEMARDCGWYAS